MTEDDKLYKNQTVLIRIGGKEKVTKIKNGVQQGCILFLFPMLFNIHIEEVMKELRTEIKQGVRIDGETINTLRFADDIAFCAEMEDDLTKHFS